MKTLIARFLGLSALVSMGLAFLAATAPANPVITAVTATSGGDAQEEWVELSNVSSAAVDLSGWQIDFRLASCALLDSVTVPAGTVVNSGAWLLVGSDEAVANGVPADVVYPQNDLIRSAGALSLSFSSIADAVDWGSSIPSCGEGTAEPQLLSSGASLVRAGRSSCPQDTNDNATDFDLVPGGVAPHSSASLPNTCTPAFTGYVRPKSATPLRVALVPAFQPCTSPNRTHGPPLAHPSCNPPAVESAHLTLGAPDVNGQPVNASGSARYAVHAGAPGGADDSDVGFTFQFTDVRVQGTLADYTGELRATTVARITDRLNGPATSDPATVTDTPFGVTVPCTPTGGPANLGATCAVTTSFDAVTPGAIPEGKRAVWELAQLKVSDGGSDGDADTAPNTLFATPGLLVP
ncbi:MAG TPA: lamin tail domain-containing protein [Solirubrobacterales bacterium]|nr:lamin tail domain-containing protein [Solirubrobacterales bacterium]